MRSSKSIVVFLIIIAALITISVVQVDYALFTDQTAQSEAAARGQLAALVPAVHSEFRALSENTKTVLSGLVEKGADYNDSVSSKAEMVARLRATETGEWQLTGKVFHEKTNVRAWAESYSVIALKTIKPKDIPQGGAALVSMLDPQRNPFFLWIIREDGDRWSAVITKTTVFQSLMDRQKGQISSVFLVNRQGQVLGHTTSEYVGTLIGEDPLAGEIMAVGKKAGSKIFKDSSGSSVQGFYEQVPYTNIFVAVARPLKAAEKNRESLRWQMILLGIGLALVGVAALVLVSRSENRGRRFTEFTPTPGPAPAPGGVASATDAGGEPATKLSLDQKTEIMKERMKAFTTSASALARELNGPLVKILSQAQLLKSKVTSEAPEAQRIESLAREGREVIQKLLTFSGEEDFRIEPTSLNESVNRLLLQMEPKFQSKGIRVEKNLKRMPEVAANHLGVMKVLEAILTNSIEAMEKMPNKVIKLDLNETPEGQIVLRVQDSGEGISETTKAKVFDPFFTTKGASSHSGLGLSMAMGIMQEFGGTIQIQGSGNGAIVDVIFNAGPAEIGMKPAAMAPNTPPMAPGAQTSPTMNPLRAPITNRAPPAPTKSARPMPAMPTAPATQGSPSPEEKYVEVPSLLKSRSLADTLAAMDDAPEDPVEDSDQPDEFEMDQVTTASSSLLPPEPSRPEPPASLRVRQQELMERLRTDMHGDLTLPPSPMPTDTSSSIKTEKYVSEAPMDDGATAIVPLDTARFEEPPQVKPSVAAKIDVPKFDFKKPGTKPGDKK